MRFRLPVGFNQPHFCADAHSLLSGFFHSNTRLLYERPHGKSGAGFTLIELLVTIAVIGLLATLILYFVVQARAQARDAIRVSDIDRLGKALLLYDTEHDFDYPPSASCTAGACTSDSGLDPWIPDLAPRYISPLPQDPGGHRDANQNAYRYISPWNTYRYLVVYFPEMSEPSDPCGYGVAGASTQCER